MQLLGLDPGLRVTGWGVIEVTGNRLRHVADGVLEIAAGRPLAERLTDLYTQVAEIVRLYEPAETAVEETFVNKNAVSTLKLGHARGIVMLAPAQAGIPVYEYKPNLVKKSVVGAGHADKQQVVAMIRMLLPGAELKRADAADALAVAVCHAHHRNSARHIAAGTATAGARG